MARQIQNALKLDLTVRASVFQKNTTLCCVKLNYMLSDHEFQEADASFGILTFRDFQLEFMLRIKYHKSFDVFDMLFQVPEK